MVYMKLKQMNDKVGLFFDRKEELNTLKKTNQHVLILGYRRMGKTHLIIKHLVNNSNKNNIPVYLDMLYFTSWAEFSHGLVAEFLSKYDEIRGFDLSSFLNKLGKSAYSIISSIDEIEAKLGSTGKDFFSVKIGFNEKKQDEFILLQSAIRFISDFAEKHDLKVIVALDEIQNIQTFKEMERGISIIRGELQFSKNIQLIISGSLPSFIRSTFLEKSKPFWKQLTLLEINPFDIYGIEEATNYFGVGKEEKKDILFITDGIPDYTVKLLQKMKHGLSPQEAFEQTVTNEKLFIVSEITNCSSTEQSVLQQIAHEKKYSEIEFKLGYPPTAVINSLIKKGIICKVERGSYRIIDPGIRYFLTHQQPW